MSQLQLAELSESNLPAACRLPPAPGEKAPVAPVVWSIAEAFVTPTAWPRVVLLDGEVVGFVMANFDPDSEIEAFRAGVWRLNVSESARFQGVGRFAVNAVADEARRRGVTEITVLWEPDGPEEFYLKLGFRPTGEVLFGEKVGVLKL